MGRIFTTESDIRARLTKFYDHDEINTWMRSPHPQLGGRTAREMIDAGYIDDVEAILDRLESGAYL